jgi:hypothetical protein
MVAVETLCTLLSGDERLVETPRCQTRQVGPLLLLAPTGTWAEVRVVLTSYIISHIPVLI